LTRNRSLPVVRQAPDRITEDVIGLVDLLEPGLRPSAPLRVAVWMVKTGQPAEGPLDLDLARILRYSEKLVVVLHSGVFLSIPGAAPGTVIGSSSLVGATRHTVSRYQVWLVLGHEILRFRLKLLRPASRLVPENPQMVRDPLDLGPIVIGHALSERWP
jgi:hypothetical protein